MQFDGNILLWIQDNLRCEVLDPIMKFITNIGNGGYVWIGIVLILLLIKKTRYVGIVSAISIIVCTIINTVIVKNLVMRTRPYEMVDGLTRIIKAQNSYSFPSGHTTASFAVAVVIFMLMKKKISVPILALALAIAFSRLYVGVHYPTDVLYALVSSSIIAVITVKVCNNLKQKGKFNKILRE